MLCYYIFGTYGTPQHIHVYIHIRICIYIYIYVSVCMYMTIYIYVYLQVYVLVNLYGWFLLSLTLFACLCLLIMYADAHIHKIYIYIYSEWSVFWWSGGFSGNPGFFWGIWWHFGTRARFPWHVLVEMLYIDSSEICGIQLGVLGELQTCCPSVPHGKPPDLWLLH